MFGQSSSRQQSAPRFARHLVVTALLIPLWMAGCSSNTSSTQPSGPTATSGPTTTAVAPTTLPGSAAPGTKLPASGPNGQSVAISATRASQIGYTFGGPPSSWAVGIEITNTGTTAYAFDPLTQVVFVDGAGNRHSPTNTKSASSISVPPGQSAGRIMVLALPAHLRIAATEISPFSTSTSPLVWSAV